MPKRTKIIATLGPATDNTKILTDMFRAGVDVVRLNFSHGERSEHAKRIENVRKVAEKVGKHIAILVDLQGPKIRIARFKQNKVTLKNGDTFILDAALADNAGDDTTVGIDYKDLPNDVQANDTLLLNDGLIALTVEKVKNQQIICTVKQGGILSNNKGINRLGGGLSAHGLTDKDKQDLTFATGLDIDYIAISFPRDAADIEQAKQLLAAEKSDAGVIAKIERVEAIDAIAEIIDAADGVMVARGDLGVEIGDAELPGVQKHIINEARSRDKPVITATQMMESMITNPIPTRAEVFDVSNAVLDGTDAVMLSAETATGKHPVKAIEAMARICIGAEKNPISRTSKHRVECHFSRIDEAIAMATMYAANHSDITAIIAMTETGSTPLWMSRIRSGIPVYALCHNPTVLRHMSLYRGVYPIQFDVNQYQEEALNPAAVTALTQQGLIAEGDWVIITRGDTVGVHGHTNSLKIVVV